MNSIRKTQKEINVTLSEIKKNLQGTNNGGYEAENQINDWECKEEKKRSTRHQEEKRIKKKKEDRLRSLWDIFKHTNIQIIGVPEGENVEQEIENLFEKIMKENFSNLVKEIDIQVQEAQRVPNKMDPKRTTPRHIIIKMTKVKNRESLKQQ